MIYIKDNIDMSLVQCPYEEEQGYIYISDEYTNSVLKLSGYNDIDEYDFQTMCRYKFLESRLYEYAHTSTPNAYYYSRNVLCGRFELGEPVIAKYPYYSICYARDVLKCRFELAEPIIATHSYFSYWYADEVVKGRFELGENAISSDTNIKNKYKQLTGIEL